MDGSREADLRILKERMNDPSKPKWLRKDAHRKYFKIRSQLGDRTLFGLRMRLIRAIRSADETAIDKLNLLIGDYSKKHGW